jgi:hypothetical protein
MGKRNQDFEEDGVKIHLLKNQEYTFLLVLAPKYIQNYLKPIRVQQMKRVARSNKDTVQMTTSCHGRIINT